MVALTSNDSPGTALTGRCPPATSGRTSTIGIRPITYDKLPARSAANRPERGNARASIGSVSRPLAQRIKVALRESYPPVQDPSGPARAARRAARADAESALVMASRDARSARGDRPGRLGARRAGPRCSAGRGLAGAADRFRRGPPVPAAAQRGGRGPARVQLRPALVPERAGAGRGAGLRSVLLARVRNHRGAPAVLRRPGDPRRRSPEGQQRSRRAADRRGAALPARLLHPVAVGRGLAGRTLPGQRSERPAADPAPGGAWRRGSGARRRAQRG